MVMKGNDGVGFRYSKVMKDFRCADIFKGEMEEEGHD
jgi:hypothetical protein